MSGFTPEEIKAHRTSLEDVATWSTEGLRWHEYLLGFAARWGQAPVSSQAPLAFIDGLLKQQQKENTEANKLLEQTIEVLERSAATFNLYMKARRYEADIAADQLLDDIPPLLDNLKAREK